MPAGRTRSHSVRHVPGRAGDVLAKGNAMRVGAPVAVDVFIDGFLLGLAFVAGQKAGVLLAVGFALEMLSLGLATCATCRRYGWSVVRTVGTVVGIGACFLVGAGPAARPLRSVVGRRHLIWLAALL
ncbi:MAG TPA: hypothetical protein VND96_14460 [Candidatus Micrarchaeaceae archaeon]|nr:hypothetical protein [Candidatus Micrarchaeaceae archaeon]